MIHLFLNADEYLAAQRITEFKKGLGDAEMADLNTSELAAPQINGADILYQASTMPFLAERRLLIVRGYLGHLDKRMAASQSSDSAAYSEAAHFLAGLSQLPDTCDLVLIEESLDKRRHLWKGFAVGKGADERRVPGVGGLIKSGLLQQESLETPNARSLPGWIQRQAKAKGIAIDGRAVQMLATFVGNDLRQLNNELEKLSAYAAGRAITGDDVRRLVSDASEALIWDLTDALSQRNGRKAMQSLYELRRNDANPFYLLTMIARQYRIMIKVRDAVRSGGGNEYDIAKKVGEKPYPVKKAMQQSRQYGSAELDRIMEQLLEADFAMKTGADPETELDVLVAELTRPQR